MSCKYLRSLEQVLGPVGGFQPEHELFLLVVGGNSGVGVVDTDRIGDIIEAVVLKDLVVLMQVEHHIAQRSVKHLPAALEERRPFAVRVYAAFAQQPTKFVLVGCLRVWNLFTESWRTFNYSCF